MQTVDGADVHDARGIPGPGGRLELRQQRPRQVKDGLDVEGEHLVPGGVGILGQGRAPVGPGVVHEDVQGGLTLGDLAGEAHGLGLAGEIGGRGDAGPHLRQLGRDLLARRRLARGDVDAGTGLHVAACDHEADSARASRDEGDLAFDREQVLHEPRSSAAPSLTAASNPTTRPGSRRSEVERGTPTGRTSPLASA